MPMNYFNHGKTNLNKKIWRDSWGQKNCAWLSLSGDTLKELHSRPLYGKGQPAKSHEGIADQGSIDFTQIASIPSNVELLNRKAQQN